MDWDDARVIKQENNRYHRWIKEAIEIRKRSPKTMNRDEGAYMLSHLEWRPGGRRTDSGRCVLLLKKYIKKTHFI